MKHAFVVFILMVSLFSHLHAQEVTETPDSGVTIHVVQRGESLWKIAQSFSVSVSDIAILNGIPENSGLQVGQRLLVPTTTTTTATVITIPQPSETLYVVQSGETLFRIAQRFGLTTNELAQANNIYDVSLIYAGQQLIIPNNQTTPQTITLPAPLTNVVLKPAYFTEGQTGSVTLTTSSPATITGQFLGQSLHIQSQDNGTTHVLMVGIPTFTSGGTYPMDFVVMSGDGTTSNFSMSITVANGGYLTTNIQLTPEQEALLAPAVEDFEISTLQILTSTFTPERYYVGALSLPVAAPMNAPFGTRRSYNGGEVNNFHRGADFAAAPNTPVYAANAGRVVLADILNIRGNTIVIDHGWGLFTLYAHLNTINVGLGDTVQEGDIIGESGATGRATGPHLHWEAWLNGVVVDPMQWTQTSFP